MVIPVDARPSECHGLLHFDVHAHPRIALGYRPPTQQAILPKQPGNGDMEKDTRFPTSPPPSEGYVQMSKYIKTGQVTATHPIDLLTCAGHLVVPVHERALRVIAPGPDVELEE